MHQNASKATSEGTTRSLSAPQTTAAAKWVGTERGREMRKWEGQGKESENRGDEKKR